MWSAQKVLYYLQALVDRSGITAHLKGDAATSPFLESPVYKMLGYFSLVGLCRVHCLLGDYRLALKCVEGIDLGRKGPSPHGLYTRVTLCHITIFYYVGWAYLMLRRYQDAIKTFSNILFYIARTKQYHTRSFQYEQILKKNEQMFALLAISASLCPQGAALDENLAAQLRDKYGDRMARMQSNHVDTSVYEELFAFSCPKFISPAPPPLDKDSLPANYNPQEALRLQLRLFMVGAAAPTLPSSACPRAPASPRPSRFRVRAVPHARPQWQGPFLVPCGRPLAYQGSTYGPTVSSGAGGLSPWPACPLGAVPSRPGPPARQPHSSGSRTEPAGARRLATGHSLAFAPHTPGTCCDPSPAPPPSL